LRAENSALSGAPLKAKAYGHNARQRDDPLINIERRKAEGYGGVGKA